MKTERWTVIGKLPLVTLVFSSLCLAVQGFGANSIKGQVLGGVAKAGKASADNPAIALLAIVGKTLKTGGNFDEVLAHAMARQKGGPDGGSVTLLRPDGSQYPGAPFTGGGLPGPWAAVVDGNDNIWISNFAMLDSPIVQPTRCGGQGVVVFHGMAKPVLAPQIGPARPYQASALADGL